MVNKLTAEEQKLIERDIDELVAMASNPGMKPKLVVETPTPASKTPSPKSVEYTFDEDAYVRELIQYVHATYGEHYSGKYQATDMIIDSGHGTGFCVGSIMKYAKRYGKKGGYNRKDILKILHYGLILLHVHDQENNDA